MSSSHLLNTIRMLYNIFDARIEEIRFMARLFQGDMATCFIEQDLATLEEEGPSYVFPIYNDLLNEVRYRKLDVCNLKLVIDAQGTVVEAIDPHAAMFIPL